MQDVKINIDTPYNSVNVINTSNGCYFIHGCSLKGHKTVGEGPGENLGENEEEERETLKR